MAITYLGFVIWLLALAGKDDYEARQSKPSSEAVVKPLKWK